METKVISIPSYAVNYIEYGDKTGLEESDIENITNFCKQNDITGIMEIENGTCHFESFPNFGKACECIDCTVRIGD